MVGETKLHPANRPNDLNDREPIRRSDDEPDLWFDRLQRFALAGPRRSLQAIYNQERAQARKSAAQTLPSAWRNAAERWHWRERVAEFDRVEREQRAAAYASDRQREREERLALLKALRGKLVSALMQLDPAEASWSDVIAGIRMVVTQLRIEYDDLPVQTSQNVGVGIAIYLPQKQPVDDREMDDLDA